MRFLLSIHDVWPGNFQVVEEYLASLRALGAGPVALLVVPEYHGSQSIDKHGAFLAWLREKSAAGSEIFLHGLRHWTPERAGAAGFSGRRSLWGKWVNRRLVDGEAEFCGLPGPERDRLLGEGLEVFRRAGIAETGFVAPTWHGSPDRETLRQKGIRFWETRFFVHCLPLGKARFAPPLAWIPSPPGATKGTPGAAKGGSRLSGGAAWLETVLRFPLIKIAIHPGDLEGGDAASILERVIRAGRSAAYRDIFP